MFIPVSWSVFCNVTMAVSGDISVYSTWHYKLNLNNMFWAMQNENDISHVTEMERLEKRWVETILVI